MDGPMPVEAPGAWERFAEGEASRPRGEFLYEDIFTDPVLFPLQRTAELKAMMEMASHIRPESVMEIGADKGGGFYHWIKSLPTVRKAVGLEWRGTPWREAFARMFPDVEILALSENSHSEATESKVRAFGAPFDCIFFDGDKGGIGLDLAAYLPMIRPGGLAFIHDIVDDIEPRRAWVNLGDRHRLGCIIDGREGKAARLREVQNLPCENPYEGWKRHWGASSCGVGVVFV